MKDLVVLVPDDDLERSIGALLCRHRSLGIRPIESKVYVHIERDSGCFARGHDFLRSMYREYAHALLIFDREGSGQEYRLREDIEREVTQRLARSGWGNRAETIVLDPELEVWVWSDSPHVSTCLGWTSARENLRAWLARQELWAEGDAKPLRPKEAVETVLHEVKKPRSSSMYEDLAERVSVERCTDPAFQKFKTVLQTWFPAE